MKRILLIMVLLVGLLTTVAAARQDEDAQLLSLMKNIPPQPFAAAKGNTEIGTTFFTWAPKNNSTEKYVGRIWYPAVTGDAVHKAGYLPPAVYQDKKLEPKVVLEVLKPVVTDAVTDAPLLQRNTSYPLLIFSPGNGLFKEQNTFLFEYLASRGFIVAAIDHPRSSMWAEKADGSFVLFNQKYGTEWLDKPPHKADLVQQRSLDVSGALDALLALNSDPDSLLYKAVDPGKIGAFGHSIGGATALQASSFDKRFKAAADLDGSIETLPLQFQNQEILMVSSDIEEILQAAKLDRKQYLAVKAEYDAQIRQFMSYENNKEYLVYYTGVGHYNFTDMPILASQKKVIPWTLGTADGQKVLLSTASLLEDFFNGAFSGQGSALEKNIARYPYAKVAAVKDDLYKKE